MRWLHNNEWMGRMLYNEDDKERDESIHPLLQNSGHVTSFFQPKFVNGMNEVLSWFGINLTASFQNITENMFCNLAKI